MPVTRQRGKTTITKFPFRHRGVSLIDRQKEALAQLEIELKNGTKPSKLSAADSRLKGYKKGDGGKYLAPLTGTDIRRKRQQIAVIQEKIKHGN